MRTFWDFRAFCLLDGVEAEEDKAVVEADRLELKLRGSEADWLRVLVADEDEDEGVESVADLLLSNR